MSKIQAENKTYGSFLGEIKRESECLVQSVRRRSDAIFFLYAFEVSMCIECDICSITGVGTSGLV
jgi:hypothetical protein